MKDRYFFIAYEATSQLRKVTVRSSILVISHQEKFINKNMIVGTIHKSLHLSNACITNIIELSESDYNDYIRDVKDLN